MNRCVVAIHRLAHALNRSGLRWPALACVLLNRVLFGCYLGCGARFGKRISLAYGALGIIIHDKVVIGDDARIGAHVVIGGRSKQADVPVIGDRVVIATGAKVLGAIRVGDEAVIGANAVVIEDVPARTVVAGVPARVIKTNIDIRRYHDGLPLAPAAAPAVSGETRKSS